MTETQKQIKEYMALLPGLKERVVAAALLLVISFSTVVSASFAWYTLSQAPEVSLLSTTVASNGNLEIALVGAEGREPDEVAIGQSAATVGQSLVSANTTWGNLVNLSDKSYGLEQIDLRPALLSGYNLKTTPLYGATYDADGRVKDVSATYEYASWKVAPDGKTWYFAAGKDSTYGVRAISSVKYENVTGNATISNMMNEVRLAYSVATSKYLGIINGTTMAHEERGISCMKALVRLLELFVNEQADSAVVEGLVYKDYKGEVYYTYKLLEAYKEILDAEGEALRIMANIQVYAKDPNKGTNYFASIDDLLGATNLSALGVELQSLGDAQGRYKKNVADLKYALDGMRPLAEAYNPDLASPATDKVYWNSSVPKLDENGNTVTDENGKTVYMTVDGIGKYIAKLVNINTTTAGGVKISEIADISKAMGVIQQDPIIVVIHDGALKDTEQRLGRLLTQNDPQGLEVSIYIATPVPVVGTPFGTKRAKVSTSATDDKISDADMGTSASKQPAGEGDAVSQDTYGLGIDLWTRTNADDAVLILEGTTLYETIDDTCMNKDNVETELYIATQGEAKVEVYRIPDRDDSNLADNAEGVIWYDVVTHSQMGTGKDMADNGYVIKVKTRDVVIGYEGENRVWKDWREMLDAGLIDEHNTTQGAGSCYVFYANPSDQTRILELLQAFSVAFIDANGKNVATAKLDIENSYAINGKVTVPLKLIKGTAYTDESGEEQFGIVPMTKNAATWLTAVVYLDGMQLENEHVLASGEIEGRLNLQFGTSDRLSGAANKELREKYRIVSAKAEAAGMAPCGEPDYTPITFDNYVPEGRDVTVTLQIEGDQPNRISGFFIRSIGSSQGSRTDSVEFQKNTDGTWTANFKLTSPGEYYMREVIVDGTSYALERTERDDAGNETVRTLYPGVIIPGISIGEVSTTPGSGKVMTAENYYEVQVRADIETADALNPGQVRALFRSKDGTEYTAMLTRESSESSIWTGTARITSGGIYTLEYLVVGGQYMPLDASQQTTLDVTLGLYVIPTWVGTVDGDNKPVTSNEFEFKVPNYSVTMEMVILDDNQKPIKDLEDVNLYYWEKTAVGDANGMEFLEMEWIAADEVYRGSAQMKAAGTYCFNRVQVDIAGNESTITRSVAAPEFVATPPEPPAFDKDSTTAAYQFSPDGKATVTLDMFYAQTAEVWIELDNVADNADPYFVRAGTPEKLTHNLDIMDEADRDKYNNHHRFTFAVPKQTSVSYGSKDYKGTQDGNWVVKRVLVSNTFDGDGNKVPSAGSATVPPEGSLEFAVADNTLKTYVVQSVNMSNTITTVDNENKTAGVVVKDSDAAPEIIVLGADASRTPTGDFMDYYNTTVKATITDWNGSAITGISDVKLSISHDATKQVAMGGYSGGAYQNHETTMSLNADGSYSATEKLQLAGAYTTELTFKVGQISYTTVNSTSNYISDFEVWSVKPTTTVSGVTPATGSQNAYVSHSRSGFLNRNVNITTTTYTVAKTANTANVCFLASKANYGVASFCNLTQPTVTIKLAGYGNASGATLAFTDTSGNEAHLYETSAGQTKAQYSWKKNGDCVRYVGYFSSVSGGDDSRTIAGTIKASSLVLTYDLDGNGVAENYTVSVSEITINNPY